MPLSGDAYTRVGGGRGDGGNAYFETTNKTNNSTRENHKIGVKTGEACFLFDFAAFFDDLPPPFPLFFDVFPDALAVTVLFDFFVALAVPDPFFAFLGASLFVFFAFFPLTFALVFVLCFCVDLVLF